MNEIYAVAQTVPSGSTEWSGMAALVAPEPWVRDALCAETAPDVFFPEGRGAATTEAKAICARCTVVAECLDYALRNREEHGVWGMTSSMERAAVHRAKGSLT